MSLGLKMRIVCLVATLCCAMCALAQPKYYIVPQLDPFTSVSVAKRINVTLVTNTEVDKLPSEIYSRLAKNKKAMANIAAGGRACVIKAEPTVAKAVKLDIEHGDLTIYANKFKYKKSSAIELFIVCNDGLTSIRGASSSNIWSKGILRAESLSLTADFAMSFHLSVMARSVRVEANSDSKVWLTGSTGSLSADLHGSSLIMHKMDCAAASVSAAGGSTAEVNATGSLTLTAERHSTITYASQGATVDATTDNSSKIIARPKAK